MMRRPIYLVMICAAAASMTHAAAQTATGSGVVAQPAEVPATQQVPPAPPVPPVPPADPMQPGQPVQPAQPAPETPPAPVLPPMSAVPELEPLGVKDTVIGKGKEAVSGSKVFVHYTGYLYTRNDKKPRGRKFDSSIDRGEPLSFVLGTGRVIKGWDQGIEGMKVGGKRTLIIPSHLAYGSRGAGSVIKPGADLIFDVQLVKVK